MAELTSKSSPDGIFGTKAGDKSCKSEAAQDSAGNSPLCPQCKSKKVWRDGIRYTSGGEVQRWLCRDCGLRFSISSNPKRAIETIDTLQTKELKSKGDKDRVRQICAEGAKNLHVLPCRKQRAREKSQKNRKRCLRYSKAGYKKKAITKTAIPTM